MAAELRWTGQTKRIMLPPIDICRRCHAPESRRAGTARVTGDCVHLPVPARHGCVTCHQYHAPPLSPHEGAAAAHARPQPLLIEHFVR